MKISIPKPKIPKLPKLPKAATIVGGLVTLASIISSNWPAVTATPGVHVPPAVTAWVGIAGLVAAALGHSLGHSPDLLSPGAEPPAED